MDNLFNAGTVEFNPPVVSVAELCESEAVVSTVLWLNREFSPRACKSLNGFARRSLVLVLSVVDLEWRRTVENKRRRYAGVARAGT